MRCIGADNPPCVRCVKSNRQCVVQMPNRQQRRSSPSQSQLNSTRTRVRQPASIPSPYSLTDHTPSPSVTHAPNSPNIPNLPVEIPHQFHEQSPRFAPEQRNSNPAVTSKSLPSIFSSSPITIASTNGGRHHNGFPSLSAETCLDELSHSTVIDLVEL